MSQSWIFYDFSVNFLLFQLQPYFQKTNLYPIHNNIWTGF
jgi:hypothetical protein